MYSGNLIGAKEAGLCPLEPLYLSRMQLESKACMKP